MSDLSTDQDPWNRAVPGGTALLDEPDHVPAVWGDGTNVLWSQGEPLLIAGPPGVGKTTLVQQAVLARIGIGTAAPLGLPIARTDRPVLYIAADRPRQATRSMRRMVTERDRTRLDAGLTLWRGPLPFELTREPERLTRMAQHFGAGTVVIDSLKDVAPGLEQPDVGGFLNNALQHLVANDIEVASLHHQRKASGDNRKPTTLADVYGSVWITAGSGSVVLLWGDAGDPVVELSHLKQPADQVGPWTLTHNHDAGATTREETPDPLTILQAATRGLTARTLAQRIARTDQPTPAQVERARRHLERLTTSGHAHKRHGDNGTHLYLPATLLEPA